MKVAMVVPGSGGTFYCENCLRDSALTKALRRTGHDVMMVPMYLPMFTDEPDISRGVPVFFGGINVYLQQKFAIFRKTPRWLDRLLDSRWLLRLAARREGSTRASAMGPMTLSMIRGEDGNQAKELDRLTEWLAEQEKPDVVHLTTSMLIGLARRLREAVGAAVVCSMQDEDTWIDAAGAPYAAQCWDAIRERARQVDAFIAVSRTYGEAMRERLALPPDRLHTVHVGIDLDGYRPTDLPFDPPVIGYLSKLTPTLGLGTLVDAFVRLKRRPGLEGLRLRAMGGLTGGDRAFVATLRARLAREGMAGDADFLPDVDKQDRLRFLAGITVMCVPMPEGEAFGTFMVEGWACGVPAVEPAAGAFPELIEAAGGGVLYREKTVDALAAALEKVLRNPAEARRLGDAGRQAVQRDFSIETMARRVEGVYAAAMERRRGLQG